MFYLLFVEFFVLLIARRDEILLAICENESNFEVEAQILIIESLCFFLVF